MSDGKRFYWLKLMSDFFSQPKIKKLRRIAGGDTYTIIYLKLQLLSLQNGGSLFYEGIEETFPAEIALTIDEDADNVSVTLNYLESQGLLVRTDEGTYLLPETVCLIGGECASAGRVRKHRERKALQCNTEVTDCNTDIEKEIEIDKEIDIKTRIDYQRIADMYNEICISFPRLTKLSEKRKSAIKARLRAGYTTDDFRQLFTLAEESSFLKGKNGRNWHATFDWLVADANMVKVLEKNYADRQGERRMNDSESTSSVRLW